MAESDQIYEQGMDQSGEPSLDEGALRIKEGFRINWMNMRDAGSGQIMWEENEWDAFAKEAVAYIPKDILKCRAVSREINFSSVELMDNFRLVQRVRLPNPRLRSDWEPCLGSKYAEQLIVFSSTTRRFDKHWQHFGQTFCQF